MLIDTCSFENAKGIFCYRIYGMSYVRQRVKVLTSPTPLSSAAYSQMDWSHIIGPLISREAAHVFNQPLHHTGLAKPAGDVQDMQWHLLRLCLKQSIRCSPAGTSWAAYCIPVHCDRVGRDTAPSDQPFEAFQRPIPGQCCQITTVYI